MCCDGEVIGVMFDCVVSVRPVCVIVSVLGMYKVVPDASVVVGVITVGGVVVRVSVSACFVRCGVDSGVVVGVLVPDVVGDDVDDDDGVLVAGCGSGNGSVSGGGGGGGMLLTMLFVCACNCASACGDSVLFTGGCGKVNCATLALSVSIVLPRAFCGVRFMVDNVMLSDIGGRSPGS